MRTLSYNAKVGTLILEIEGKEYGYYLDRLDNDFGPGVVTVRLTKFRSQRKTGEPVEYDVLASLDGEGSCECRGFLRWGKCKHQSGLVAMIKAGKIA